MLVGEQLLSDLGNWPSLKKEMQDFHEEIKQFQKDDFERWCTTNLDEINSNELTLQTNAQVVYFEAGKDMKVMMEIPILESFWLHIFLLGKLQQKVGWPSQ